MCRLFDAYDSNICLCVFLVDKGMLNATPFPLTHREQNPLTHTVSIFCRFPTRIRIEPIRLGLVKPIVFAFLEAHIHFSQRCPPHINIEPT